MIIGCVVFNLGVALGFCAGIATSQDKVDGIPANMSSQEALNILKSNAAYDSFGQLTALRLVLDLLSTASTGADARVVRDDQMFHTADLKLNNGQALHPEHVALVRIMDASGTTVRVLLGVDLSTYGKASVSTPRPVVGSRNPRVD